MGTATPAQAPGSGEGEQSATVILRNIWKTLKTRFLLHFIFAFSIGLFFSTLLWVLAAAICWPAENAHHFRTSVPMPSSERRLEIWGPRIVPVDQSPVEIRLILNQTGPTKEPLRLFLTIPDGFTVLSPDENRYTHEVELDFTGNLTHEVQTLQLANAQIFSGLTVVEQEIALSYAGEKPAEQTPLESLPLGVEPTLRATLRRYGGGDAEIPFFPLTTLFMSVAGFIYREIQQRKQEEERQIEQKKSTAKENLQKLRQAIKDGQIDHALSLFDHLTQEDARKYLESHELKMAERLLDVARGNLAVAGEEAFPEDWLEEAAAALVHAANHHPTDRRALEGLLRSFPVNDLPDAWRGKLETIKTYSGSKDPIQMRDWPPHPPQENLPQTWIGENPFPYEEAELDVPHLFGETKAFFWSEHPLCQSLKTARGAVLVTGEAGSGKSALALALGAYRYIVEDRQTFGCYVCGTPTLDDIYHALAQRLLAFIEHLPTFLVLLNHEQRALLAQTLVIELGRENVLGRLGYASQPEQWKGWLDRASSEQTKKIWEAETNAHLKLLCDAVASLTPYAFSERQWLFAFMTCLHSLNFNQAAYLILDADETFTQDWYEETILRRQHRWAESHLHTITFTSPTLGKALENAPWLKHFDLTWDENQLKEMALWRWRQVAYERQPLAASFAPGAFGGLLEASQRKPRCFIRLWHVLLKSETRIPFALDDILRAKEQVACR